MSSTFTTNIRHLGGCCIPFCKPPRVGQNIAYYSIRREWIPTVLNHIKISNHREELTLCKICAYHYSLLNLEEKVLNTRICFPLLKISVSRHSDLKVSSTSELESNTQQTHFGSEAIKSKRRKSDNTAFNQPPANVCFVLNDHSYAITDINALKEDYQITNAQNETLRSDIEILQQNSKVEIQRLKKANDNLLNEKIQQEILKVEHPSNFVVSNPASLKFYTGFENTESFDYFLNIIKTALQGFDKMRFPRRCVFKFNSQLIMVLMKLRLDLLNIDLSHRFNISYTTIIGSWNRWLELLLEILPQESCKLDTIEKSKRKLVFIELDQILILQKSIKLGQKLYSRGKSLLHLTPKGFIVSVSDVYPSNLSDHEILKLEDLEPDVQIYNADQDPELLIQLNRILVFSRSFLILKGSYIRSSQRTKLLHKHWKIIAYLLNFIFLKIKDEQVTISVKPTMNEE